MGGCTGWLGRWIKDGLVDGSMDGRIDGWQNRGMGMMDKDD